ncbi:MAG TPA: YiiX/YebB-like N1pC/P60 family cysteine hydrolase [Chitinophagaceae bacterium]
MKKKIKRWLISCLLIFIAGCKNAPAKVEQTTEDRDKRNQAKVARAKNLVDSISHSIRSGDMVTRTGNDFTSFCFRQFCQLDKTYSHCGIISIENDTVFVYHALGGEFNPDQKLLREPLSFFVAPAGNHGFGVFRFQMTPEQTERLLSVTKKAHRQEISFDMKFDLATDEKMYCSEFTAKMYRRAFQNDSMFTPSRIAAFSFLSPDNLFTHPLCQPLFTAIY